MAQVFEDKQAEAGMFASTAAELRLERQQYDADHHDSNEAEKVDHEMTTREAFRMYWKVRTTTTTV
jgi:hypothetical protein